MKKTATIVLFTLLPLVCAHLYVLQSSLVVPISIADQKTVTMVKLQSIGVTSNVQQIAKAVEVASKQSGLSTDFLIALMWTESSGKLKAKSVSGYSGLMQIPFKVHYADANMIIGAHIFNEKLKQSKGDVIKAICLYKGYEINSSRGVMQANKVLALRNRLKQVGVDNA
jgi:hypothetical protein